MSPLRAALAYAQRGWPVFPRPDKGWTGNGWHDATIDPEIITKWWKRWPRALIAMPTGMMSGIIVLDIDVKRGKRGFDDWARIDPAYTLMPTPFVWTPSGGWHVWLLAPEFRITSSGGVLGNGLDVLSDGMSVPLPTPGWSDYRWDKTNNPTGCAFKTAPKWLAIPQPPPKLRRPLKPVQGLSPYADAAIARACIAIRQAPDGQQHLTLRREAFSIGTLAGAGGIPQAFARAALLDAAEAMPAYRKGHKWTAKRIKKTVDDCFEAGLDHPRESA